MGDFFGFGGYTRPAEGYLSWQHLLFVSILTGLMILFAVLLGKKYRYTDTCRKIKVLMITAVILDGVELTKIIILCLRSEDPMYWVHCLPLFLCSIQLISVPLAAFSRGRLQEASLDFICIFGLLGAVLGTYGAGNNYAAYPVLSLDNVASGITHTLSGFAALYIYIVKVHTVKGKNMPLTCIILTGFCAAAFLVNSLTDCNYMFLVRGDGTPYDILYDLLGGNPVLYPVSVVLLFFVCIGIYYGCYALTKRRQLNNTCV